MRRSLAGTILLVLVFLGTFGTALFLQNKGIKAVLTNPPFYDTWQLAGRSGEAMKILTLRYDIVFGDFLWLRAIQSFGGRGMTNRDWRPLYNQFDAMTELDPYFPESYKFAHLVIGDEGGQHKEGLKLINKGMDKIYRQYRLPFEGMYVAHWELKDQKLARWYGRVASKRKDAPDWTNRITAYIDVQSGEYYVGFDRFVGNLLQALDSNEYALEHIALSKVKETIEKWNLSQLGKALDEYSSATGKLPERIDDLASMPSLQNFEVAEMSKLVAAVQRRARDLGLKGIDPRFAETMALPTQRELMLPSQQTTGTKDAKKLITFQNEVFKESLVKRSGIPEEPYGTSYTLNKMRLASPGSNTSEKIQRTGEVEEDVKTMLFALRQTIAERKRELGRNPRDLHEVFYTDFNTTEPAGGRWMYDPESTSIRSSSFPHL